MTGTNSLADALTVHAAERAAPVREQVISTIRQAILEFRLQPGQRLVERELVEHLGVSRTTVREALRELASEGLVAVIPQRGAVVATPTADEAADLYAAREVLESLLVRRFCERATVESIADLKASITYYREISRNTTEIRDVLKAKDRFYAVLIDGARSPALQQILGSIQARVQVLRATSLSTPGRALVSADELDAIADAITLRDADLAASLTAAHVRTASRTATAHMAAESPTTRQRGSGAE